MHRELVPSKTFVRALRKYLSKNPHAKDQVKRTLEILSNDAFAPKLRTHKLKGDLEGAWACSAGYDLRILFEFTELERAEAILLLTIGSHDSVY